MAAIAEAPQVRRRPGGSRFERRGNAAQVAREHADDDRQHQHQHQRRDRGHQARQREAADADGQHGGGSRDPPVPGATVRRLARGVGGGGARTEGHGPALPFGRPPSTMG